MIMIHRYSHAGIEAVITRIINREYDGYVSGLMTLSGFALSIYSTVIRIEDEMEYIWLKPFTFPTILYLLGRYTSIIALGVNFISIYLSIPPSSCNALSNVANITFDLNYIGYIGLIVARAYSLCRNKLFIALLMLSFGAGLFSIVFKSIAFSGCFIVRRSATRCLLSVGAERNELLIRFFSVEEILMTLGFNIVVLLIDFFVFNVSLYKVWDTWYLKRKSGIQTGDDLVSTLLKQTISRFSFAILLNLSLTIVGQFMHSTTLLQGLSSLVQALGPVLITNYMLDLRRHNSKAIQANYASLPPIQSVQDVLQHIQQSVLVEMADAEDGDADASLPVAWNSNMTIKELD